MINFYLKNKKTITQLLIFAASLLCVYIFFKYILGLVLPFITAYLLAKIISPPVDYITKKKIMPRSASTALFMTITLLVLAGVLYRVFALLTKQIMSFTGNIPAVIETGTSLFASLQQKYYSFFEFLPEEISMFLKDGVTTILPGLISAVGSIAKNSSFTIAMSVPKAVVFIIITIVSTFFMVKDKQAIAAFAKRQIPDQAQNVWSTLKGDMFQALWGYIRAQLILMSISGTIAVIGLTLLGYEYSFLIGLTIAVFDALPIFGAGFVLWPWTLFSVLSGNYSFAVGLFVLYLCITLCRQMTEPKILSSQIGLYPLVTIASIYIGLMTLGALGILAGPIFVIVIKSLQKADFLPKFK